MSVSVLAGLRAVVGYERFFTLRAPEPVTRRRALPKPRSDSYVLGERLFKDVLVRERKRTDRLGSPFAVIVVDHSERDAQDHTWLGVQRAASAVKRDVDTVGWLEHDAVLGVILPDTNRRGALKVLHHLQRELARRLGTGLADTLSIRIYAHGIQAEAAATTWPSVDLLLAAFVPRRTQPWRDAAKRGLDIVGSIGLLALFAPVMLGVYIVVRWTSPGPVFFRQVRIGRRGEPFTMLKFRTMYTNSSHGIHQDYVTWFIQSSSRQAHEKDEVFKLTSDPRITPPGKTLRKTSLDELPQFWNVLRGDMSLVGPRPPLPFEVAQYQPWHRRRVLEAKPGITGLWQVKGRSRTTFDEMVRMDLEYARTHTLWMDIRILAATPLAMVKGAC